MITIHDSFHWINSIHGIYYILLKNIKNSDTVPIQSSHKLKWSFSFSLIFTDEDSACLKNQNDFAAKIIRTHIDINN